jgi:pimeloyl-ACP methyl ester carboxylesterase
VIPHIHINKDDDMVPGKFYQRVFMMAAMATCGCPATAQANDEGWHTCPAEALMGPWPGLEGRLACRTVRVPLDANRPNGESLPLEVVRVKALQASQGTVLVEPDAFAAPLGYGLATRATHWGSLGETSWPAIVERYDLVTVANRRFPGNDGQDCVSASEMLPGHVALGNDPSPTNLGRAEARALAIAAACASDPLAAHVGTWPRIADLERVRKALGVSRWHVYAVGDAAWSMTRYAERHPDAFSRMLIDGGVDFDAPRLELLEGRVAESGRRLRRLVRAIAADPVAHEMGDDEEALWAAIRRLPRLAAEAWLPGVDTTEALRALLILGDHIPAADWNRASTLRKGIESIRFSPYPAADTSLRVAAMQLVARYGTRAGTDPFGLGSIAASPAMVGTHLASLCNDDDSLHAEPAWWRLRTDQLRMAWPGALGNETFAGLVCAHWQRAWSRPWHIPDVSNHLPILMVHAEYDRGAPLRGAVASFHPRPQVSMVVARGITGHQVADRDDLPCVAVHASRFLLDGTRPSAKLTNCPLPDTTPFKS